MREMQHRTGSPNQRIHDRDRINQLSRDEILRPDLIDIRASCYFDDHGIPQRFLEHMDADNR